MLDKGGKKYREKTKVVLFGLHLDKFDFTKAADAYNVKNDPLEKCREGGKKHWVCSCDLL